MQIDTRTPGALGRRALIALALAAVLGLPTAARAANGGTQPAPGSAPPSAPSVRGASALHGTGMWIWILRRSHGGNVSRIVAQARRYRVRTLFIKSGDGVNWWSQFSPSLVRALKRSGLRVCGWQYVYGDRPLAEAYVSARARRAGADCFVIDAESEYEGRYVAADQYVRKLRALVGRSYPIALAGFPYVDFHPSFPYSVFLAPGAAQFNQPQMYWRTIGTTVDANFAHTYTYNRVYKRSIFPLGQTYDRAPPAQIRRFRQVAISYGARGVSWWDWQETLDAGWRAIGDPVSRLAGYVPSNAYPLLRRGSRGDLVVWAQQLLWSTGRRVPVDGVYGAGTAAAVADFQQQRGLPATGQIADMTWPALLRYRPVSVRWRSAGRGVQAYPARRGGPLSAPAPRSASLRARGREIPAKAHGRG
jgi:hypothetical protein